MWSWLFRSRALVERQLAVETCRRELAETDAREWRQRYEQLERKHDRLLNQVLARDANIPQPLHDTPQPAANPLGAVMRAMNTTEFHRPRTPSSEAAMPAS